MKKRLVALVIVLSSFAGTPAYGQGMSVDDLKSKGATVSFFKVIVVTSLRMSPSWQIPCYFTL